MASNENGAPGNSGAQAPIAAPAPQAAMTPVPVSRAVPSPLPPSQPQVSGPLPMFVQSNAEIGNNGNFQAESLDLDDLFHDCYFGEFPYGSINTAEQHGAVPAAPATILPPPPPPPPLPPTAAATGVSYPQPLVPNQLPQTIPSFPMKRKVSELGNLPPPNNPVSNGALAVTANPIYSPDANFSATTSPSAHSSSTVTKNLTEQQKVERRERNREHAKRSRLRKKFLLESLQEQINGLNSEIDALKDIITTELPDKAEKLLETISIPKGNFTPLPMPSGFGPVKTLMEPDYRLMSALSGSQQNFAISDPSLPDNPIVYVSQGFLELTGYTLDQVLGRNCRFLQGPGTDQSAVDVIRKGVREGTDTSVCLLNYKADGTPFWNQFFVAALQDAENNVVNFVGVQCEVSKAVVDKQMAEKGYGIKK